MDSVFQKEKRCYLCGAYYPLHSHHIFGGANRNKSERDGMKVRLCPSCHMLVHENGEHMRLLKKRGQRKREELYGDRNKFIRRYRKNYL